MPCSAAHFRTSSDLHAQQCGPPAPAFSRLAAAGLKFHEQMVGKLLPFAGVSKLTVHVAPVGGGERVLAAPDCLKHQFTVRLFHVRQPRLCGG